MANFLLIHGGWHGAWMWDSVVQELEIAKSRLGVEEIIAVDLPGHGRRVADDIRRITLDYYIETVVTPIQLKRLSEVTIVAHSFAAAFMPEVAIRLGSALERIVFVGGMIPPKGTRAFDTLPFLTKTLARMFKPQEKGINLPGFMMKRSMCNGMRDPEAQDLIPRLVAEPYLPWAVPLPSPDYPDEICLSYVVLTKDGILDPKMQRVYAGTLKNASIIEIQAGHEAPLTHAAEVAEVLLAHTKQRKEEFVSEGAQMDQNTSAVSEEKEIEATDE